MKVRYGTALEVVKLVGSEEGLKVNSKFLILYSRYLWQLPLIFKRHSFPFNLLVHQNVTETGRASIHVLNGLVGLLHRTLLDPRVYLLVSSELQHLTDLIGATDEGSTKLDTLHDQREGGDLQSTILRGTELDESSTELEELAVLNNGHLRRRNSGDDQIQRLSVLSSPVLILTSRDVRIRTELQRILLLVTLAGDCDDAVSTKCLGEENTKVTETTDTDDTDRLAGSTAVLLQGRVGGDTTAEHRSSLGGGNGVGDLDDKGRGRPVVKRVSTIRLAAVGISTVICANHAVAVLLEVASTRVAVTVLVQAGTALRTNTDAVSNLDVANSLGANAHGSTDDLVSDTAGVLSGALNDAKCQCF